MDIIPAIDLKDGKVVRLTQGKFQEVTIYSDNPVDTAKKWVEFGAQSLHVVDLDGAVAGESKNMQIISQIARQVDVPIQVGGGIRDEEAILQLFNAGVNRVVLGTKAVEDSSFVESVTSQFGSRIIVSIDSSMGKVATDGWTSITQQDAFELAKSFEKIGVKTLIFTDISRDGTLIGPNFANIEKMLAAVSIPIIAAGGISNIEDIKKLLDMSPKGIEGVIIGKALYETKVFLKEAIDLCSPDE